MEGTAVFEFFVRKLQAKRNFLIAAGLEQVLGFLENVHLTSAASTGSQITARCVATLSTTWNNFASQALSMPWMKVPCFLPTSRS